MANTFKRILERSIGINNTQVGGYFVPGNAITTIIGLSVANLSNADITVDVAIVDNATGNLTHMVKGGAVPIGAALVVVGGEQKIVLQPFDIIIVKSSAALSADVIMSILETTP